MSPKVRPTIVTVGMSALASAWRKTTSRSGRPFPRAVRMYSAPSTSSMLERARRVRHPHVQPAGPGQPAEPEVEDVQAHQPQPEDRAGDAEQRDGAHQVVDQVVAADGG